MKPIRLTGNITKHMVSRGMPRDIMRMHPYNLSEYTVSIESVVDGMKTRKVSKKVQLENFEALLTKPFGRPYIMAVSSSPNDGKAKLLAAHFMEAAMKGQLDGAYPKTTRGRELPLWHTLTGSFYDRLRDGARDTPSMIVLSNITSLSSNVKLEKARDLLEQFNYIPRIVVIAGEDPVTFANTKLLIPINYVLHLSVARKIML